MKRVRSETRCGRCDGASQGELPGVSRAGFTLVEMLVAVTLILLMMTMFAQIFQVASGSLTKMKGIGENDQRVRLITATIRNDINKRTYRVVTPIQATGPGAKQFSYSAPYRGTDSEMQGYIHLSEGDTNDDTDDLLQLTVDAQIKGEESQDVTAYGGRAVQLGNAGDSPLLHLNQPVMDDARAGFNTSTDSYVSDGASESRYAEVVYFLRRGTLYRRSLLLRDPQPISTTNLPPDVNPYRGPNGVAPFWTPFLNASPTFYDKLAAINGAEPGATGNFYTDFDFAAFVDGFSGTPTLRFHSGPFSGFDSLASTDAARAEALARPQTRFGFHPITGRPVSYDGSGRYLGRFTHGETSFRQSVTQQFGYPGVAGLGPDNAIGGGDDENPYFRIGLPGANANRLELDNATGIVRDPTNSLTYRGPRYGEDVLMTNVLSFDIKVYDHHPEVRDFVDLGHSRVSTVSNQPVGHFNMSQNRNPAFGPKDPTGADGAPGVAGVDDDQDGLVDNASEVGMGGDDVAANMNRCFDTWWAGLPTNSPAPFLSQFSWKPPYGTPLAKGSYYRGTYDLGPDELPGIAGWDDDRDGITDRHGPVYPAGHPRVGQPDPRNGLPDYEELGYPGSDDFPETRDNAGAVTRTAGVPQMLAVQITIRFLDPVSNQVRDCTLRCNLVDDDQAQAFEQ
jgi:prepilin-type N-terminal cleavage/methylation domain-containing protein